MPVDVRAQIYPPANSSSDALESILEKCEIAGRCLKCIQCIMSEVGSKTDTIQETSHLDDSNNFLLSANNALYKYHNIVIDDTEFNQDRNRRVGTFDMYYKKLRQREIMFLTIDSEQICNDLEYYIKTLNRYKSSNNLCVLASKSLHVLQKWAVKYNLFHYHLHK